MCVFFSTSGFASGFRWQRGLGSRLREAGRGATSRMEGTYKNRDPFVVDVVVFIIPILLMVQKFCTRNNPQHV